jgi:hypothetical protein
LVIKSAVLTILFEIWVSTKEKITDFIIQNVAAYHVTVLQLVAMATSANIYYVIMWISYLRLLLGLADRVLIRKWSYWRK